MEDEHHDKIDLNDHFDIAEIKSNYLRNLLKEILSKIVETTENEEIGFGWVREGFTYSGEAGEVTEDGHIILNSIELRKYEDDVAMAIIAHELAHYHCNHYSSSPEGLEFENEADDLAKSWGFDIDKFRRVCGPATIVR
jgi:predicted metal-dependent hydrolase